MLPFPAQLHRHNRIDSVSSEIISVTKPLLHLAQAMDISFGLLVR